MKQDYPHMRAFGRSLNKPEWEIEGEIRIARDDGAPADAVYRVGRRYITATQLDSALQPQSQERERHEETGQGTSMPAAHPR